jgi:tetratricopeptide (TPR) repeat protein
MAFQTASVPIFVWSQSVQPRWYHPKIVNPKYRCSFFLMAAVAAYSPLCSAQEPAKNLDREFQTAVADYNLGKLAQAAAKLEKLVLVAPKNSEVQELLGLVYSAESRDARATEYLENAVRLTPDSAPARTNLAANLVRMRKMNEAEEQFRKAAELSPENFDTNHNLGEFYVRVGNISKATPFLEHAQQIDPSSYDNGYDLSLAYIMTGRLAEGRQLIRDLLKRRDTAELHDLLGDLEEQDGQFVAAENEYELAAHEDPSESNLFDWGSELLMHRTLDPAVTVFQKAVQRYPNSPRLMIGLGMALYSRGNYDDAVKALLKGADLNPTDSRCYLFLSRAYDSSPSQADAVIDRFRRYSELEPSNAKAQYYYAISLWKGRRTEDPNLDLHQIEWLLKKSLSLDPKLADAHFQLANLYSDQSKYAEAIPEYVRARELNPDLADAYYRLGQAYVRTGERARAQQEFRTYQRLRQQHLADLDQQRAEIRQFVLAEKNSSPATQ